jgi:hypothetical protein
MLLLKRQLILVLDQIQREGCGEKNSIPQKAIDSDPRKIPTDIFRDISVLELSLVSCFFWILIYLEDLPDKCRKIKNALTNWHPHWEVLLGHIENEQRLGTECEVATNKDVSLGLREIADNGRGLDGSKSLWFGEFRAAHPQDLHK